MVKHLQVSYEVSERRACSCLGFGRSSHRYSSIADGREDLRIRLKDVAASMPSYGYSRLGLLLRRESWEVNHKLVHRLYREEGLALRTKRPKRRVMAARRAEMPKPMSTNQRGRMDFMSDQLYSGRAIRPLRAAPFESNIRLLR